jgi:hypothetical protein
MAKKNPEDCSTDELERALKRSWNEGGNHLVYKAGWLYLFLDNEKLTICGPYFVICEKKCC